MGPGLFETKKPISKYEEKRQARIDRLRARAEKKRAFASENDLSLYGEAKSGIPLGQPILVGHHSERRHRKHLERIENKVRKGFEAAEYADRLEQRADAAENRTAIDSDNPEALKLIDEKIVRLQESVDYSKKINKLFSRYGLKNDIFQAIEHFKTLGDTDSKYIVKYLSSMTHCYSCKELRMFTLSTSNTTAEIRRLKKRREGLKVVQSGFESFKVNGISVELVDGQVQVEFGFKPDEETRQKLKRSPLALKWSSYSKRWVRKHTEATAGRYFKSELIKVLESAKLF